MQSVTDIIDPPTAPAADLRIRLRSVAVSPHEEYHLRPGQVRPISNDLAAAILSRKGRVEITLKGIVVDRVDMGGRNTFWHEDSILCNDLAAAKGRKIYYKVNPLLPDIVHLLEEDGSYIESLPLKFRPEVLNTDQQEAEVRKQNRQINRAASRLQQLHGETTRERLADLQANSREMQRVVQTMPAPAGVPRLEEAPESIPGAGVNRGTRQIEDGRQIIRDRNAAAEQLQSYGTARDWETETYQPERETQSAWDALPEDAALPAAF